VHKFKRKCVELYRRDERVICANKRRRGEVSFGATNTMVVLRRTGGDEAEAARGYLMDALGVEV
jgi:hypothetical protein